MQYNYKDYDIVIGMVSSIRSPWSSSNGLLGCFLKEVKKYLFSE